MPNPRSLGYERALELLVDGKWHDYHEILRKVARTIPPGVAMRQTEYQRLARARVHGGYVMPNERKQQKSEEELIFIGATSLARKVLNGPAFEIEPRHVSNVPKKIRMRPDHPALQSSDGD